MSLYSSRFLRILQQMTVEQRPWALKSCTDPSHLSSTVKFGLKRVEVVSQNGSSPREDKRQSSLGPTHPPPHPPPSIFLRKIDYLPVLSLRAGLLRMFDAFRRLSGIIG